MTDDRNTESYNSYSSQLWYTAVCYILQFILISALRFFSTGRFDKQSVQHSAADTLLLTSVFILLQWSGILFSYGIYRLPHVMVHLLVDLIPTLAWVFASELAMLMSFAVAFKLYHHLAHDGKVKLKRVTDCMGVNYLKSISSHQNKLHHATKTYIKELFPRLVEKSNYTGNSSPGLALVFAVLFHLLELSTIGLVLLNTIIELTKTSYKKMSTYKVKDAKQAAVEVGELTLVSLIACAILQYELVTILVAKSRQLLKASGTSSKRHPGTNNESSPPVMINNKVEDNETSADISSQTHDD